MACKPRFLEDIPDQESTEDDYIDLDIFTKVKEVI